MIAAGLQVGEERLVLGMARCTYLCVEDAGAGINEKERGRLLERFYSQGNANSAGLGSGWRSCR